MAKDRLFFLISLAFLGIVAAYSFSGTSLPPPSSHPSGLLEAMQEPADRKSDNHILELSPGKIAMPLLLNSRSAIVNFMNPGDMIDVLFTSKSDIGFGSITLPLLNNIRVLGIGRDPKDPSLDSKSGYYKSNIPVEILIEMTPRQAEIFNYAENTGHININISQLDPKEGTPVKQNYDGLLEKLLKSDSEVNFNSILVTHMVGSLFPDAKIKVLATAKGYIVSGTVPDQITASKIIQTLNLLSGNGEKSVVSLIKESTPQVHIEHKENSPLVEILAAKIDLNENQLLRNGDYNWVKIKSSQIHPTLILKNSQSEERLTKAIITKNIRQGEHILESDLIAVQEEEKNKPDFKIRPLPLAPGKRAIPFRISTRSSITQFLKPGLHVDIKFTSRPEIGFDPVSVVLLRNIRILSIENDLQDKESAGRPFSGQERFFRPDADIEIFMEMTAKQARTFAFAIASGLIALDLADLDNEDLCNPLVKELLKSDSLGKFQSTLVTYMIRKLFPLVDLKIIATPKGYIVEGDVPDPQMAEKIMEILVKLVPGGERAVVNMMNVEPQQVLLCVKVLEVSKDIILRYGINWHVLYQTACKSLAFGSVYPNPLSNAANYFYDAHAQGENYSFSALIDMMEEDGVARVLAEPNLTTISGVKANFFAGGEFPVLIPQGGSLVGTVTVEYKKYGVILEFTPVVDLNGLITLHVVPEVSNIDKENAVILNGFIIPSLIARKVDTIVKLWPGQSYLVAGLYLDELTNKEHNLYGLNRIPIIGSLFGSRNFHKRRTDLLIVVTPFLINNNYGYPPPPVEGCEQTCPPCQQNCVPETEETSFNCCEEDSSPNEHAPSFIETAWEMDCEEDD